jgi:VCBS repeat-containing protein
MNVLANDIDPEHDAMVAVLQTSTQHGALAFNADGTFDYTPNAGYQGVDTFTYTAYDFITESHPATVRISVGLRGDADQNHVVDGADFLAWQRGLGAAATPPGSGADGDGDGAVNAADVLAWSDNFGISVGTPTIVAGTLATFAAVQSQPAMAAEQSAAPSAMPLVMATPLDVVSPLKTTVLRVRHAIYGQSSSSSQIASDRAFAAFSHEAQAQDVQRTRAMRYREPSHGSEVVDEAFARLATRVSRGLRA